MTRACETARVAALRAEFAASDEPDVWRWFARRELADPQPAAEPAQDRTDDAWSMTTEMEAF